MSEIIGNKKVSIIVPVHNSAAYINHCCESLIRQTYRQIEILLIENGSTDQSYQICLDYTKIDDRIKAFHLEESGVSRARNFGIEQASGEYIVFADSDDYCEEDWCLRLIEAEEKGGHAYVPVCGYFYVSGYEKDVLIECIYEQKELSYVAMQDIFMIHRKSLLNSPCNKLYQKSVIVANHIFMPEDISLGEDLVFNLRYLDVCDRRGFIVWNQPLYNYVRSDKESLNNCFLNNYHYAVQRMYDALSEFCEKKLIVCNEVFWQWALQMYERVLRNTYNSSNPQNGYQRYRYNNKVLKDQRLAKIVNQLGQSIGIPAYVGYKSRNYGVLQLMHYYEKCKWALREKKSR